MKKLISVFLVLTFFIVCTSVASAEMGVQVIGGPETETKPVSLDDIKLGIDVTIDDYGQLTPIAYTVQDELGTYRTGDRRTQAESPDKWYYSGQEAEFIILKMDIVNLTMRDKNFLENVEVKAIFDEKYEYGGWFYQFNYDNQTGTWSDHGKYKGIQNTEFVIAKEDMFPIGPMYLNPSPDRGQSAK